MIWFMVWQVISTLVELVSLGYRSERAKDLEILLLRRQLAIYERRQNRAPRLSRGEKLLDKTKRNRLIVSPAVSI